MAEKMTIKQKLAQFVKDSDAFSDRIQQRRSREMYQFNIGRQLHLTSMSFADLGRTLGMGTPTLRDWLKGLTRATSRLTVAVETTKLLATNETMELIDLKLELANIVETAIETGFYAKSEDLFHLYSGIGWRNGDDRVERSDRKGIAPTQDKDRIKMTYEEMVAELDAVTARLEMADTKDFASIRFAQVVHSVMDEFADGGGEEVSWDMLESFAWRERVCRSEIEATVFGLIRQWESFEGQKLPQFTQEALFEMEQEAIPGFFGPEEILMLTYEEASKMFPLPRTPLTSRIVAAALLKDAIGPRITYLGAHGGCHIFRKNDDGVKYLVDLVTKKISQIRESQHLSKISLTSETLEKDTPMTLA